MRSTVTFQSTVEGRAWAALYIPTYVVYLLLQLVLFALSRNAATIPVGQLLLANLAIYLVLVAGLAMVSILVAQRMIPAVRVAGEPLTFTGSAGRFLGLNLAGLGLSIVTLGVFSAWWMRNVFRYFASSTAYRSTPLDFGSSAARLFVIFLLAAVIPMIVAAFAWSAFIISTMATTLNVNEPSGATPPQLVLMSLSFAAVSYVVLTPFIFLVLRWEIDVAWRDYSARLEAEMFPACGMIASQILLTLLTLTIYAPVGYLRLLNYFAPRVKVQRDDRTIATFRFAADYRAGFLFLWGQGLLVLVTLGIYYPWAVSRVWAWAAERLTLERFDQGSAVASVR